MPQDLRPYASIPRVLLALIQQKFSQFEDDDHVGTRIPTDLADRLFYAAAVRIGGPNGRLQALAVVDLDIFGAQSKATEDLAGDVDAWIMGYPHRVETGGRPVVLDSVTSVRSQVELPWEDTAIRRYSSTYQISVRR